MTTIDTETVQQTLLTVLASGDVEALDSLLSKDFVHHRPDATRSKSEWMDALSSALEPLAGMQLEIEHLLAADDHIIMRSRRSLPDDGPAIVVVDIWRVENGQIAEGWELIEPVDQAATNWFWWAPADRSQPASR